MKSVQMILSACCFGVLLLAGCSKDAKDCTQYSDMTSCNAGTYAGTGCRWNPVAAASCSGSAATAVAASCAVTVAGTTAGDQCNLNTGTAGGCCSSLTTAAAVTNCTAADSTNCAFTAAVSACTTSSDSKAFCCTAGTSCATNVANCNYVPAVTTANCSNPPSP